MATLRWTLVVFGLALIFLGLMVGVWGVSHNYVEAATYHAWEAELYLLARDGDGEASEKVARQKAGQEIYPGPKGATSVDWPMLVLSLVLFALGGSLLVRGIALPAHRARFGSGGDAPGGDAP